MKNIKESIKTPLNYICNKSFSSGPFPSELKIANVEPICKSGDEMVFLNCWPVFVLPVFSKLLERLMCNRLICFINENKLLHDYLSVWFSERKVHLHGNGCDNWQNFRSFRKRGVWSWCVSRFFYRIWYRWTQNSTAKKTKKNGIKEVPLKWCESYLSERTQYVT